jgi:hypothetical protein
VIFIEANIWIESSVFIPILWRPQGDRLNRFPIYPALVICKFETVPPRTSANLSGQDIYTRGYSPSLLWIVKQIWLWVPRDSKPRMTVLARPAAIYQTLHILLILSVKMEAECIYETSPTLLKCRRWNVPGESPWKNLKSVYPARYVRIETWNNLEHGETVSTGLSLNTHSKKLNWLQCLDSNRSGTQSRLLVLTYDNTIRRK